MWRTGAREMGQEGRVFSPEALSKVTSQHDVTGRGAEENHPLSGKIDPALKYLLI